MVSKKSEFQELFSTIKSMCRANLSLEDKKVLSDFLRTLRYICEFDLLKTCYDQNATLKNIIPDIDTKLINLKKQLDDLRAKVSVSGELSSFEEVKLKAYKISYDRYNMIKEAIVNRNFEAYTTAMNKNLNGARQIIAACSASLNDANIDFLKDFRIGGVSKTPVDIAFDIQDNPQLLSELMLYYKKDKNISVDYVEALNKDQEYLRYLHLADRYQDLLKHYMLALRKCGSEDENREVICQNRINKHKLDRARLNSTTLSALRNKKVIMGLDIMIEEDEETLEEIRVNKDRLLRLDKQIREVGLGPIIDQFNYAYRDYTGSVEQRIVDFIKVSMRKKGLDISRVESNVKAEIDSLNKTINKRDEYLSTTLESMSEYGRELVTKYPKETKQILDVVTNTKKNKVNPILSAYVLKSLMTAQNLSYEDINDIINVYDVDGMSDLVDSYESVVASTINSIESNLMDAISRAEFDVNDFSEMRLK